MSLLDSYLYPIPNSKSSTSCFNSSLKGSILRSRVCGTFAIHDLKSLKSTLTRKSLSMLSVSYMFCIMLTFWSSIYSKDVSVITSLTKNNFDSVVTNSLFAVLVDFFSPSCPVCRRYAPVWEKIGLEIKKEHNDITFGGVDCEKEDSLCRKHNVSQYPTIIAFNFKEKGESKRLIGGKNLTVIRALIDSLQEGKNPSSNKNMVEPIKKDEEENKHGNSTGVVVASVNGNTILPSNQGDIEVPPLEGDVVVATLNGVTVPPFKSDGGVIQLTIQQSDPTMLSLNISNGKDRKEMRLRDATAALLSGLLRDIFAGRETLSKLELESLQEWLRILSKVFPGKFNKKMIYSLWYNIKDLESLALSKWTPMLHEWQDYTLRKSKSIANKGYLEYSDLFSGNGKNYTSCTSFTCGQWMLLHIVTCNSLNMTRETPQLPVEIYAAIRQYMMHFFSCEECRQHFLDENPTQFVNYPNTPLNSSESNILWLWEFHNKVSKRLNHPQWPIPNACTSCQVEEEWNQENVLEWLIDFYCF